MPLRKRWHDLQKRHSSREIHQKSLPNASAAAASNQSSINDCVPSSSSQGSSIPFVPRKSNEVSTAVSCSFTAGASPGFAQAIIAAESQINSPDISPLAVPVGLWNRAYEQLKAQDEQLIGQFEKLLAENPKVSHSSQALASATDIPVKQVGSLDADPHLAVQSSQTGLCGSTVPLARVGTVQRQNQMKALLNEKIKMDEDAVWKFRVGDNQIVIRDQLSKVVKVVAAAKDFVGAAIASDPHAALAWTGICTLLPLLLIPSEQREANTAGLAKISDLVQYYHAVEVLYHQEVIHRIDRSTKIDFESKIVDLYTLILEYQARTIRQLSRNVILKSYGKTKSSWNDPLNSIQKAHLICKERMGILNQYRLQQALEAQESRVNNLQSILLQRLDELQFTGNETLKILRDQEQSRRKEKLEAWLGRIDQSDTQAARQRKREPETCQWFFENDIFKQWLDGTTPFVWLNGDVGCGKSILCSSIVEKLQHARVQLCTTAYFYFSWDNSESHDLGILLRCILAQLASDSRFLARLDILKREGEKRVLNRDDMSKALLDMMSSISAGSAPVNLDDTHKAVPIVLVFDALDEVPFGAQRDAILDFLSDLSIARLDCLRIIATSRRDIDIEERLVTSGSWKAQGIQARHVNHDIGLFVRGQMSRHSRLKLQSHKIKDMISKDIVGMANGMFQLASLQMEELQGKNQQTLRPVDVERTLGGLPRGVEESYKRILERIQVQDQVLKECLTALKWLVFSKRPLYLEELVDACITTPSAEGVHNAFDVERRLNPTDLVNNLVGLVTVEPYFDRTLTPTPKSKYIVSLAHFSVHEFLVPSQRKRAGHPDILNDFTPRSVHDFIAKSCLAYIAYCAVIERSKLDDYVLREYAWHWWAGHSVASVCTDPVVATRVSLRLFNSVVFPVLYGKDGQPSDIGMEDLRSHWTNLTAFLRPVERDSLVKALSDTEFGYIPQKLYGQSASPAHSVLRQLPDDPRALRLLVLHPEKDEISSEVLKASLCIDVLDNEPVYTALSYTWDTWDKHAQYPMSTAFEESSVFVSYQRSPNVILVNGELVQVRTNLGAALLRLRLPEAPRVLWVDALCISMDDLEERSAQVQRMSDIYLSAEEVAVWLGRESSSSKEAMQLLLAPKEQYDENGGGIATGIEPCSKQSVKYHGHLLKEVFSRPLWKRSWVIQEIVCAKKVTLHCGPYSLDWDDMRSFDGFQIYDCTSTDRRLRAAAAAVQKLRYKYLQGSRLGLSHLLFATRYHACTHPADKIFSMLSLLSEADAADELLRVDYTKPRDLIFGLATQFILTKSQDLNLLSYSAERSDDNGLPSWVPNWMHLESPPLKADLYNVEGLQTRARQTLTFPRQGLIIAAESLVVDKIDKIIRSLPTFLRMDLNEIKKIPEAQTKFEVCCRTVLADCVAGEDKQPERIGSNGLSFPQDWSQTKEMKHVLRSPILTHLKGRAFFTTDQGYVGFTHSRAKEGDVVAILSGARVPFVLRIDRKELEPYRRYRLIAQCYVHGIMDGEFIDEDPTQIFNFERIYII